MTSFVALRCPPLPLRPQIDDASIAQFVADLDPTKVICTPSVGYPLAFADLYDEVNFMALTQLLNIGYARTVRETFAFGVYSLSLTFAVLGRLGAVWVRRSGYRRELHDMAGKGAWDTILFGCMGMFLSGRLLNADFMVEMTISDVEQNFGIPLTVDKPVSGPIKMSVPGPLRPLADKILFLLNDTGRLLRSLDYNSLGHFILDRKVPRGGAVAAAASQDLEPTTCAALVARLTTAFPAAFSDVTHYTGGGADLSVAVCKKVQVLCSYLHHRFNAADRPYATNFFKFSDVDQLTIFADNVIPCMLRHFGVLKLVRVRSTLSPMFSHGCCPKKLHPRFLVFFSLPMFVWSVDCGYSRILASLLKSTVAYQ